MNIPAYFIGAVVAQIAVAWWVQLRLSRERAARLDAELKQAEAETKLFDAIEEFGRLCIGKVHDVSPSKFSDAAVMPPPKPNRFICPNCLETFESQGDNWIHIA